jgi:2-C-methyl-D-erythritol 2,4-cyclodiphosphate synthase
VEIPFERGLSGWSDADVLVHAIMDALLGAAGLGDIGQHFPPGDPQYKDISSISLLSRVMEKLADAGWKVNNVDATVVAERPRLSEYRESMRNNISETLETDIRRISVKASTADGLGFVGRGEGIAAYAVATIEEK